MLSNLWEFFLIYDPFKLTFLLSFINSEQTNLLFMISVKHFFCSPDSAMRRCRALSPSSGHHGLPGPSAAQSVGEECIRAPGTVRMEIAVQGVRWYVHLKYTHTCCSLEASCLTMITKQLSSQ